MTRPNREKLFTRIRALFSKTVEAGATEAEAMAAAEKARALLEKYQLDLGAEELRQEGFVRKAVKLDALGSYFGRLISSALQEFCDVKIWYNVPNTAKARIALRYETPATEIEIFGLASDVELAEYLLGSLAGFALAGANVHVAAERKMAFALATSLGAAQIKELHRSYLFGCANPYGAIIKLDKPKLVLDEMERRGIRLGEGSSPIDPQDAEAFAAGSAHGAKASFGRPVAGGRIAGLIGRAQGNEAKR